MLPVLHRSTHVRKKLMKKRLAFLLLAAFVSVPAWAGDWDSAVGFSSSSERSEQYNRALGAYLMQNGITPGATVCMVAGSCQSGGTSTNLNGVAVIDNSGSGVITVDIDTDDTDQSNTQIGVGTTDSVRLN